MKQLRDVTNDFYDLIASKKQTVRVTRKLVKGWLPKEGNFKGSCEGNEQAKNLKHCGGAEKLGLRKSYKKEQLNKNKKQKKGNNYEKALNKAQKDRESGWDYKNPNERMRLFKESGIDTSA